MAQAYNSDYLQVPKSWRYECKVLTEAFNNVHELLFLALCQDQKGYARLVLENPIYFKRTKPIYRLMNKWDGRPILVPFHIVKMDADIRTCVRILKDIRNVPYRINWVLKEFGYLKYTTAMMSTYSLSDSFNIYHFWHTCNDELCLALTEIRMRYCSRQSDHDSYSRSLLGEHVQALPDFLSNMTVKNFHRVSLMLRNLMNITHECYQDIVDYLLDAFPNLQCFRDTIYNMYNPYKIISELHLTNQRPEAAQNSTVTLNPPAGSWLIPSVEELADAIKQYRLENNQQGAFEFNYPQYNPEQGYQWQEQQFEQHNWTNQVQLTQSHGGNVYTPPHPESYSPPPDTGASSADFSAPAENAYMPLYPNYPYVPSAYDLPAPGSPVPSTEHTQHPAGSDHWPTQYNLFSSGFSPISTVYNAPTSPGAGEAETDLHHLQSQQQHQETGDNDDGEVGLMPDIPYIENPLFSFVYESNAK